MKTKKFFLDLFVAVFLMAYLYIGLSPIFSFGFPSEIGNATYVSILDGSVQWGYSVYNYKPSDGPTSANRLIPNGRFILGFNPDEGFHLAYLNYLGYLHIVSAHNYVGWTPFNKP